MRRKGARVPGGPHADIGYRAGSLRGVRPRDLTEQRRVCGAAAGQGSLGSAPSSAVAAQNSIGTVSPAGRTVCGGCRMWRMFMQFTVEDALHWELGPLRSLRLRTGFARRIGGGESKAGGGADARAVSRAGGSGRGTEADEDGLSRASKQRREEEAHADHGLAEEPEREEDDPEVCRGPAHSVSRTQRQSARWAGAYSVTQGAAPGAGSPGRTPKPPSAPYRTRLVGAALRAPGSPAVRRGPGACHLHRTRGQALVYIRQCLKRRCFPSKRKADARRKRS